MSTQDPFLNPPGTPSEPPTAPPEPPAAPQAPPVPPSAGEPVAPPPGVLQPGVLQPGVLQPGVLQPGVMQPGVLPPQPGAPASPYGSGAVPPSPTAPVAPPIGAFPVTAGPPPVAPNGLAGAAIVLSGAYAAVSLISAATTPGQVETLKETSADPNNATFDPISTLIGLATFAVGVAAFVVLALWMARIRANRTRLGETPGGPPAVEWWGWFIPLANFVLPFLGMRAITKRLVGIGVLLAWWLTFCATWVVSGMVSITQFGAIDYSTGELTNTDVLDQMIPLAWASAALVTVSWLFLVVIIRKTTAKHLER